MRIIALIFLLLSSIHFGQEIKNEIQIGIYSRQASPGSLGHKNGTLSEVKSDIESLKGIFNAAIPYRHWNRVDYPDWDYNGYFINYMKDMFQLTYSDSLNTVIQTLTPPLYSSFINPPASSQPDDDKNIDRSLDIVLFGNFVENVLKSEIKLVYNYVKKDTSRFLEIILDKKKRPIGGWYLDDEPLIRNHDIEVIESMAEVIRLVETKVFYESSILRDCGYFSLGKYKQLRYLAFDADDLHNYPHSSRKSDAKTYNYNGSSKELDLLKKYTVFRPDTYDVLMADFYHDNKNFWEIIFKDTRKEFVYNKRKLPLLMPIIRGFKRTYEKKSIAYQELVEQLSKERISGIWLYSWQDTSEKTIDLKNRWLKRENDIPQAMKMLKK